MKFPIVFDRRQEPYVLRDYSERRDLTAERGRRAYDLVWVQEEGVGQWAPRYELKAALRG
jgi:hypothetical protein